MCSGNARKSRGMVSVVSEHVFGQPRLEEGTASVAVIIPLTTIRTRHPLLTANNNSVATQCN
jgi:hypothetical protein